MSDRFLLLLPASVWLAVLALGWLLIRIAGWEKVRQHGAPLVVLCAALLVLPAGGVLGVAWKYRARVLARLPFLGKKSAALNLSGGCAIFPSNNVWNVRIDALPLDPRSQAYVASMGPDLPLHADFSVPYAVADSAPVARVDIGGGAAESDPGPYRIPDDAPVEDSGDAHVLVVDRGACTLYELFSARRTGPHEWQADSGAIFDLRANRLRPLNWTSADAAGLPIFPGLVRYDEVAAGDIRHALRFTTRNTRRAFVWPARHYASRSEDPALPPMGQRFRLRASFDLDGFSPATRVILTALQHYGMFLSDNGGPWFVQGAPDRRWPRSVAAEFRKVVGRDFEAVDSSALMADPDSAAVR